MPWPTDRLTIAARTGTTTPTGFFSNSPALPRNVTRLLRNFVRFARKISESSSIEIAHENELRFLLRAHHLAQLLAGLLQFALRPLT